MTAKGGRAGEAGRMPPSAAWLFGAANWVAAHSLPWPVSGLVSPQARLPVPAGTVAHGPELTLFPV